MPQKTDSSNPAHWLDLAESDMDMVKMAAHCEVSFLGARGKLAEILEKILKAELLRIGWTLEKTHDLERLLQSLVE